MIPADILLCGIEKVSQLFGTSVSHIEYPEGRQFDLKSVLGLRNSLSGNINAEKEVPCSSNSLKS